MTLPMWAIPTTLTVLIWAVALLKPLPPCPTGFGFTAAFTFMLRLGLSCIGTLIVWLVYVSARLAAVG
jgi:hypothetical protein